MTIYTICIMEGAGYERIQAAFTTKEKADEAFALVEQPTCGCCSYYQSTLEVDE